MNKKQKVTDEMGIKPRPEKHSAEAPRRAGSSAAFVFSSPFGPRIPLAPEGGAAGAGGADGGAGSAGADPAQTPDPAAAAAGSGETQKPERPDYIPENFWDAEKGFKSDDFNALLAFKAEHDANLAQVPETKDGYRVSLPADFKLPDGIKLPEGQEISIDESDPRIAFARDFAHSRNMSQTDFEQMLALGVQMDVAQHQSIQQELAKQAEQLGPKGKERVSAVTTWLGAKIGGELAGALAPMLFTAKQVEAFEAVMRLNRGQVPGNPGSGRDAAGDSQKIQGFEKMTFRQRMAAIDATERK